MTYLGVMRRGVHSLCGGLVPTKHTRIILSIFMIQPQTKGRGIVKKTNLADYRATRKKPPPPHNVTCDDPDNSTALPPQGVGGLNLTDINNNRIRFNMNVLG